MAKTARKGAARTAVIYARFSCSKQREASIDDQLRICREWCDREGYEVVGSYCDYAISGRTDDRPEFQRMVANAGESDIVLVYMMDRFSRDVYDAPIYKKRLRDAGVRVVSATEAIPDESDAAMLLENIYEAMAAMESERISKRTKRGLEGNALKGMHNGVWVYGYDFSEDGRYKVNEEQAEIVREVFARRLEGENMTSIAADLAMRGVKTYAGNPVAYTFVKNMLGNEKYTGVYLWDDVRIEGGMPRIIDRRVFEMAQLVVSKKQRKAETWDDYRLAGKGICGGCGMGLVGASGRGRGNVKYTYYRCGKKCGHVSPVRADWLEDSIAEAIRGLLADEEKVSQIARIVEAHVKNDDSDKRLAAAQKRKRDAEKAIDRMLNAVAEGLDPSLAKKKIAELRAEVSSAVVEIAVQENAPKYDTEDFVQFLQCGAGLDDARLIDAFVYQVMICEEDVIVTLNYDIKKFEPARLSLKRVRTSDVWLLG